MSVFASDYPEKQIKSLPKEWATKMAMHCLAGWKYTCGSLTGANQRWWTVVDPAGKKVMNTGGIELAGVVHRVQVEINRRELRGVRIEGSQAPQAWLGQQLGPKAGLVRRAR